MTTLRNILIGFLIGGALAFVPLYMKWQDSEARLAETRERLQQERTLWREKAVVAGVHGRLATLLLAIGDEDFATARSLSTKLFDEATRASGIIEDADSKRRVLTLLQTRDEVTAALAVNDASIAEKLSRLLALLGESL